MRNNYNIVHDSGSTFFVRNHRFVIYAGSLVECEKHMQLKLNIHGREGL